MGKFLTNYGIEACINVTPELSAPTWAVLGEGFDNFAEAMNEVVNQYQFLNNGGYSKSMIAGAAPVCTMTGVRILGDTAQDFIFSKKYEFLSSRETDFRIQYTDSDSQTVTLLFEDVTLANLQEWSGASTDGSAISVEIHYSGAPTVTNGTLLSYLSVVSVAGTTSGDTAIYVNPVIEDGNLYYYETGESLSLPIYGADVSSLTLWNGTDEITATTGNEIMMIESTSGGLARKGGIATVTSA